MFVDDLHQSLWQQSAADGSSHGSSRPPQHSYRLDPHGTHPDDFRRLSEGKLGLRHTSANTAYRRIAIRPTQPNTRTKQFEHGVGYSLQEEAGNKSISQSICNFKFQTRETMLISTR